MPLQELFIFALLLALGILAYTALVVKEEWNAYRDSAKLVYIGPFSFPVPSWWKNGGEGIFECKDWRGAFQYHRSTPTKGEWELMSTLAKQGIVPDGDCEITTANRHCYPNGEQFLHIVRITGTATEKECRRIYLDIFLAQCSQTGESIYGESKSSVLGGLCQGPYFEECLKELRLSREPSKNISGLLGPAPHQWPGRSSGFF